MKMFDECVKANQILLSVHFIKDVMLWQGDVLTTEKQVDSFTGSGQFSILLLTCLESAGQIDTVFARVKERLSAEPSLMEPAYCFRDWSIFLWYKPKYQKKFRSKLPRVNKIRYIDLFLTRMVTILALLDSLRCPAFRRSERFTSPIRIRKNFRE